MQVVVYDFTLTFGRHELLDLFDEIVHPAFFAAQARETSHATYFFHGPELWRLDPQDSESLAIVGRLVKSTLLTRSYTVDGDRSVKPDPASLPTAPISTFVLLLDRHWLLYARGSDTGAPAVSEFQSAIKRFLVDARRRYIAAEVAKQARRSRKQYRADLSNSIPPPLLSITPVPLWTSLSSFVDEFSKLQTVELVLTNTNAGLDFGEFLKHGRRQQQRVGASRLKITEANPQGLKKDEVKEMLRDPAASANVRIALRGKDAAGRPLKGTNERVQASAPIRELPVDNAEAGRTMHRSYKELQQSGTIQPPSLTAKVRAALASLAQRFRPKS